MKIKVFLLIALFTILVFGANNALAQLPYGHGISFVTVPDTVDIDVAQDGVVWYSEIDSTFWFTNGTVKFRVPAYADTIALAKLQVDTLEGFSADSIFVNDDFVLLMNLVLKATSSNLMYFTDAGGDTVITFNPNASGGPSFYMMDGTSKDSVRFYHDGTKFNVVPDAGTAKIDVDGTFEADSLRSEDGNFAYDNTNNKTLVLMMRVTDSLYVGKTSKFIGVVTVTDSTFSDTLTSNMAYLVTIHNDSLDSREITVTDSVFADTARINMAYLTTISADSMNLRELTVTDSAYIDTTTTAILRVTGKAQIDNGLDLDHGTTGVKITNNSDGALTFLGMGNGADENVTIDLDSKTDTVYVSSGTGANTLNFAGTISATTAFNTPGKTVIGDSLRVEETARIKGAATFGTTATPAYIGSTGVGAFGGVAINTNYGLYVGNTGVGTPRGIVNRQSSATTGGASFSLKKSRGSLTAGTIITTGDTLGTVNWWGCDANEHWVKSAQISAVSTGTIASTRVPSYLSFSTGTDAAPTVLTERMRIDNFGNFGFQTTTPNAVADLELNSLGATLDQTKGLLLQNNTAAGAGAQQMSPALIFRGNGWKTDATAGSDSVLGGIYMLPVQGTSAPTGRLYFATKVGSTAWKADWYLQTNGILIGTQLNASTVFASSYFDAPIFTGSGNVTISADNNNSGSDGIIRFGRGSTTPTTDYARFTHAGNLGIGTTVPGALLTVNSKADTLAQFFGDKDGKLWTSADSAGLLVLPNGNVEIGNASTTPSLTLRNGADLFLGAAGVKLANNSDGALTFLGLGNGYDENLTLDLDTYENEAYWSSGTSAINTFGSINLGKNSVASGQLNFIASDNDLANIAINTSDQLVHSGAAGGYTFDALMGVGTTAPLANSVTLGNKATQMDWLLTRENVAAGTDSSIYGHISNGVPYWRLNAADGDTLSLWHDGASGYIAGHTGLGLKVGNTTELTLGATTTTSYNNFDPSTGDNLALGASAAWKQVNVSDYITLGGKGQDATLYVSKEATFEGTDSSVVATVDDGDGKVYIKAGDADSLTLTTSSSLASIKSNNPITVFSGNPLSLDVTGTGNSYVEVIQDNNAGMLAVGRTTGTESSMITVCDGGGDNLPGFWQMLSDDGNGNYHWHATDHVYRVAASLPADDDADGYAIIDADDGTIGGATQAVIGDSVYFDSGNLNYSNTLDQLSVYKINQTSSISTWDSLITRNEVSKLDSGATYTFATGVSGWGEMMAGDNQEWAHFRFSSNGTVTLIANTANVDNVAGGTALKVSIYDGGSGIVLKNNLAKPAKNVAIRVNYYTP